jgi:hypothetical protein
LPPATRRPVAAAQWPDNLKEAVMRSAARIIGLALTLTMVALAPGPAGAQSATKQSATKSAESTLDAFKDYTIEKKNDAVAHGKKLLRDADVKLKQVERQTAKSTGEVKTAAQQQMKELKAKRADLSRKLDDMGKATAASWDKAKEGFTDGVKDLQQGYDKVVALFK